MDPIKKEYFCKDKKDKTKLNWFCYEYAFGLYAELRNSKSLKGFYKNRPEEDLVQFCVFFSKRMKCSIFQRLSGQSNAVIFHESDVEFFYSEINPKHAYQILKAAMKAWDELTSWCVTCPNRCISERNRYCHMFDEIDEDGSYIANA